MPAMRAVPSTSPFLASPASTRSSVWVRMTTLPSAIAMRSVAGFRDTSTMFASPLWPRWVRVFSAMAASGGLRLFLVAREQLAGRERDVRLAHQAFADQKGAHAGIGEARDIGGREDPALPPQQMVLGQPRRQPLGGGKRRLEGAQIAIVDADQHRAELERAIH